MGPKKAPTKGKKPTQSKTIMQTKKGQAPAMKSWAKADEDKKKI